MKNIEFYLIVFTIIVGVLCVIVEKIRDWIKSLKSTESMLEHYKKENKVLKDELYIIKENAKLNEIKLFTKEKNIVTEERLNAKKADIEKIIKDNSSLPSFGLKIEEYSKLINIIEKEHNDVVEQNLNLKQELIETAMNTSEYNDNWIVGRAYERYIGYLCECNGYIVTYNGAINGLSDLGRDLIAEKNNEILIIQCKLRSKSDNKKIFSNVVAQLYGTVEQYKLHNSSNKFIKGVIVTSVELDSTAKQFAKDLNIDFFENQKFMHRYPTIKCKKKNKLYYTEYNSQYDYIQMSFKDGDQYVYTPKDARKLGYRKSKDRF